MTDTPRRRPGDENRPPRGRPVRPPAAAPRGPSQAVREVARACRRVYRVERSRFQRLYHGAEGDWAPPAHYDGDALRGRVRGGEAAVERAPVEGVWFKLAAFLLAHRLPPAHYIRVQFELALLRRRHQQLPRAPEPAELMNAVHLDAYRESGRRAEDSAVRLALGFQTAKATQEITIAQRFGGMAPDDAAHYVLTNEAMELSSLFRHCVAWSMPGERFAAVAREYLLPGVIQFMANEPAYLNSWAKVLPPDFAATAHAVYDSAFAADAVEKAILEADFKEGAK